jgi:hypothetical protein
LVGNQAVDAEKPPTGPSPFRIASRSKLHDPVLRIDPKDAGRGALEIRAHPQTRSSLNFGKLVLAHSEHPEDEEDFG